MYFLALRGMNYNNSDFYSNGEYQYLLKTVKQYSVNKKKLVIIDAGANIGEYSILASKICTELEVPHTIYCFEPSSITYSILVKNTQIYQNIIPINEGLGDIESEKILFGSLENGSLSSLYQHDSLGSDLKKEKVQITTIDLFAQRNNIKHIDLIKIDVEGNELNVLKGGTDTFDKRQITNIQFEFGGTMVNSKVFFKDIFEFLSGKNISVFRILPKSLKHMPIYSEQLEIFMYSNYVGILN